MLLAGRTAANLELTDIARETRVPIRHLKALEADKHDELPALPYAIGFVKSYARAVGLDPETVAGQFRSETSKSAHVPTPVSLEPLDERRLPSRGLWIASLVIVIGIIASLSAWGAGAFDPPPPFAPEMADTAVPEPAVETVGAAAAPAAASAAPGTTSGPVMLTATRDVWVKISDTASGATLKVGVLSNGESFTVPADRPAATLWTGMAGAISVSIGGQTLPPLGGPVETIRNISLLPADLIARSAALATPSATAAPSANAARSSPNGTSAGTPAGTPAADPSLPAPIATPPAARPIATIPGN
jgi:cytoskeletal protein RodZ